MTMLYVLLVLSPIQGGVAPAMSDFPTKDACERAATLVKQQSSSGNYYRITTLCIPKE